MSVLQTQIAEHHQGCSIGLYSVCCSNDQVLRAAMQVARHYQTPLLIEATSNQVDQFGGYTGMRPAQFRDYVWQLAQERNFPPERVILGGDHLGPNSWQKLPAEQAMGHARTLVAAYVEAGFQKIHLDCSMPCAGDPAPLSDEIVAERSAELALVAEQTAARAGLAPPNYVVGTEVPVPGGEAALAVGLEVTHTAAAARTLEVHREAFTESRLGDAWQRVIALVVQPGVDFDHSHIHHYDAHKAASLSAFVARQPSLVFEAHSTDYQTEASLHQLVRDHFAILKVGPAATYALREAVFALAAIENELLPSEQRSRIIEELERCMREEPRHWQKHYAGSEDELRLLRKYALSDRCRYYWGQPPVQQAMRTLMTNLTQRPAPLTLLSQFMPEQYGPVAQGQLPSRPQDLVQHKVFGLLAQYARACARNHYEGGSL